MALFSGFLPNWFGSAAANQDDGDLPYYFWRQEHFDAAKEIVSKRRATIKAQQGDFKELLGDLGIMERAIYGDLSEVPGDQLDGKKTLVLDGLKTLSVEDKKEFLKEIYNLFNRGMLSESMQTYKWLKGGRDSARQAVGKAQDAKTTLSKHAADMNDQNTASNTDRFRAGHIAMINTLNNALSKSVAEMDKGLDALDYSFGIFYRIITDAQRVFVLEGDEFNAEFTRYLDQIPQEFEKLKLSEAGPENFAKWEAGLKVSEQRIEELESRQATALRSQPANDAVDAPALD